MPPRDAVNEINDPYLPLPWNLAPVKILKKLPKTSFADPIKSTSNAIQIDTWISYMLRDVRNIIVTNVFSSLSVSCRLWWLWLPVRSALHRYRLSLWSSVPYRWSSFTIRSSVFIPTSSSGLHYMPSVVLLKLTRWNTKYFCHQKNILRSDLRVERIHCPANL